MSLFGTVSAGNDLGMKNRIINGAMVIDQRNAGASVTPTNGQFTLDRYQAVLSQASKYSIQQNAGSVTPPVGFSNYLGVTSLSAYTVGATEIFTFQHAIEGYNIADLNWGSANAKTVTLSFQVRSSLTGTFGGVFANSAGDRIYPFTYSISVANTWTSISVTIAGDTSGTWLTTNGLGILIRFGLGVGSTYSGTAGAWTSSTYYGATGATSVVGTNGATFYITGVQLEKGSTATSFDYRHYGTELQLCQRYYYQTPSYNNGTQIWGVSGTISTGTTSYHRVAIPTVMRTTPSIALNPAYNTGSGWSVNLSSLTNSAFTAAPTIADYLNGTMVAFYAPINNVGTSYHCLNTDLYVPTGVNTNNIQLSAEL